MASDDDQRQVERVTARAAVEVENEIPCPDAGEEVDVGEPTVVEGQRSDSQSASQSVSQPARTVRVGGSSAEVRKGKVKMLKNWQRRRKNNILMQMLRCLHTRHGELKTLSRMQQMQRPNK